jgi:hypothetical protein
MVTDELTTTFFHTFGIEPKKGCTAYDKFTEEEADVICDDHCLACLYFDDVYPQINDSIYLELVAILNMNTSQRLYIEDVEDLKVQTLKGLISCHSEMGAVVEGCDFKELQDMLVQEVQKLFK